MPPNPNLDPRLNPWPLPPGWAMPPSLRGIEGALYLQQIPTPAQAFQPPPFPAWGASGWNWGQGGNPPGMGISGLQNYAPQTAPPTRASLNAILSSLSKT